MVVISYRSKLHNGTCNCRPCKKWLALTVREDKRDHERELHRILFNQPQ